MNWYAREEMAETARHELDRLVELRRSTMTRRRSVRFWLLATLRTWIISATR